MRAQRWIPIAAAAGLALMGVCAEVACCAGWRVNLTASEPRGLYRLQPLTNFALRRGTLVEFCPPAWVTPAAFPFYMSGDCPGGGRAMLKTVVGIPGDRIAVTDDGVSINGVTLPGSASKLRSGQYPEIALPVLRGEVVLQARQFWIYGGGERPDLAAQSFDSRYFGPVAAGQIGGWQFR